MSKSITCGCGFVVSAASDDELLANAEQHVSEEHADALAVLASASLGRVRAELGEFDRRLRMLEAGR